MTELLTPEEGSQIVAEAILFARRVGEVAAKLTDLQKRAIDELDDFYGRGPRHLSSCLNISIKEGREILNFFRREGICDYGPLFDEDSGAVMGRGYWLDKFGRAVKEAVLEEMLAHSGGSHRTYE